MPRRKTETVSLGGAGRVAHHHDDATPERLVQARRSGEVAIVRTGVRCIADPFDLLRNRNLLDRLDVATNETLWHAGDRLRRHWHRARFDGLSAIDLSRPSVDGGGSGDLAPSEAAQRHRDEVRRAAGAVGPRLMPYVSGVVLEGRPVLALRALVNDSAHPRTADALALERLREGLHRLCDVWDMRSTARPLPLGQWRAEAGAGAAIPAEDRQD